jgi:hypothetical protein
MDSEMENDNDEPLMRSKCNKAFENEYEYLEHHKEKHKPEYS